MVNVFNKENFKSEVEEYKGTTIVDFYADWCGPCKMMSPVIDKIAEENKEIKVGKVNCDDERDLATRFNVMSIPTILIFKDGKLLKTFVGVTPKETILEATK